MDGYQTIGACNVAFARRLVAVTPVERSVAPERRPSHVDI
jgi:hypothetical protein